MNDSPRPTPAWSGLAAERRLVRLVRARALAAQQRGWPPLDRTAAEALLDAMTARFDAGPALLAEPTTGSFYARLGEDEELAETFVALVSAARLPAALVPAGPLVDLDRLFGRTTAPAAGPALRVLAAVARRLALDADRARAALAALAAGQTGELATLAPAAAGVLREPGGQPAPPAGPVVLVTLPESLPAAPGRPAVDVAFQLHARPAGRWQVLIELRQPGRAALAAGHWAISATVEGRALPGHLEEPGLWALDEALDTDAVAALIVTVAPASGAAA